MNRESGEGNDFSIDVDDSFVDGDGIPWSIVSVNLNERTATIECHTTPLRTIPVDDLEKMKRHLVGQSNGGALAPGVVAVGIGSIYEDQDHLYWTVKVVNLRERTLGIKLMTPPRRTITVEQLRDMRAPR